MTWTYKDDAQDWVWVRSPRPITLNGVQHPRAIFEAWTEAELNAIGIYQVGTVTELPQDYALSGYAFEVVDGRVNITAQGTYSADLERQRKQAAVRNLAQNKVEALAGTDINQRLNALMTGVLTLVDTLVDEQVITLPQELVALKAMGDEIKAVRTNEATLLTALDGDPSQVDVQSGWPE